MKRRAKLVTLAAVGALAALGVLAATGAAGPSIDLTPVPHANAKVAGMSAPNLLSPELQDVAWAQGSNPVENPSNGVVAYGYDGNGTFLPVPSGAVKPPAAPPFSVTITQVTPVEAQKTEPDKNTYLVLDDQKGADSNYDYGRHFLFQGHEAGKPGGSITRINLDADGPHRVTLMATKEVGVDGTADTGKDMPTIDGSTWDPWAGRLLFTAEGSTDADTPTGGVWQGTLDVPSKVVSLQAQIGVGGYEGIQNDDKGQLYIVEDIGGTTNADRVKPANSFVYRFKPSDPSDLTKGGVIQALQVLIGGQPITAQDALGTASDPDKNNTEKYKQLHTYGTSYATKWVDLKTTTSSSTPANVNVLAKSMKATPFKRPENGVFQPGSHFEDFYFDETGDTDTRSKADSTGKFGAIFHLSQKPSSNDGEITVFVNGDLEHAAFDNLAFFGENQLGAVEDRGDTLHGQQANGLDSAWMFDTTVDYSKPENTPVRFIAEGRDASATIDSALGGLSLPSSWFSNDGDNEITGIHVSDGDPGKNGILGAKKPKPFDKDGKWRAFWTQQHGDNVTYELVRSDADRSAGFDGEDHHGNNDDHGKGKDKDGHKGPGHEDD